IRSLIPLRFPALALADHRSHFRLGNLGRHYRSRMAAMESGAQGRLPEPPRVRNCSLAGPWDQLIPGSGRFRTGSKANPPAALVLFEAPLAVCGRGYGGTRHRRPDGPDASVDPRVSPSPASWSAGGRWGSSNMSSSFSPDFS